MRHLIISREYPPAAYAPGGIGTYAANITRLMAEQGEIVHVIAQRWPGAPKAWEAFSDGRLIVHRIGENDLPANAHPAPRARMQRELDGLKATDFPNQWFAWHAAFLAEHLIEHEGIDVIEGQEWEAPLYYLLLRRALGMAPRHFPPCIVHLHSATAFIRHYNGAFVTPKSYTLMKRMEDFCIRSADALLCPSRYYAAQCIDYFGLPQDSINVIPLPVGFTPLLERGPSVWAQGSICFVGRIEPRKGIIEWMTAAARVASERRDVQFAFIGADIWGLQSTLEARLAPELRHRFRFHGSKPREDILPHLAAARAAVLPSRWENFPNVCIEAMSSGLPVIATRLGGMVELIEDGRTGWLTPDSGVAGMVDGLAAALRRCLAASPQERAAMGLAASRSVARICDNASISDAHIAFRSKIAERGAWRSLSRVVAPPSEAAPFPERNASPPVARGAGLVVRARSPGDAEPVLDSLRRQTVPAGAIAVVCAAPPTGAAQEVPSAEGEILVLHHPEVTGTDAWNVGFAALRSRQIGYWLFLDEHDALAPTYLERVEQIFAHRPEVGIVAPWTLRTTGLHFLEAPPCADLVHQLTGNDVPPASAFRAEALGGAPPFRTGMPSGYAIWDVANALLLKGWAAVTLPEALATRDQERPRIDWPEATVLRAIRAELLAPFMGTASRTALDLVNDYVPFPWVLPGSDGGPPEPLLRRRLRYLGTIVFRPRKAVRAVLRRLQVLWRRIQLRRDGASRNGLERRG
jgi:glycosyltransferase involved in cell wall biosynthesis